MKAHLQMAIDRLLHEKTRIGAGVKAPALMRAIGHTDLMLATICKTPFSDSNWLFEWEV